MTDQQDQPVHIVAILDRSASMGTIRDEAIGAFNKFLTDQQALPGECNLTMVQFDNMYETPHQRAPINTVPQLDRSTFVPRGMTALYDAVVRGIAEAKDDHKVVVCILTDGEENSSREVTLPQVKKLIEEKTQLGWSFVFLSADINAFGRAGAMGIQANMTVQAAPGAAGFAGAAATASYAATNMRTLGSAKADARDDAEFQKVYTKAVKDFEDSAKSKTGTGA